MNDQRTRFDEELARLQGLLAALEGLSEPAGRAAARALIQAVLQLHAAGLTDVLRIVDEAGSQPADTLPAKFAANPRICGLLLLHDLHPEDLATRAQKAVDRLRPHLGVVGVRAEFVGIENGVVRVRVSAAGQTNRRPSAEDVRREIEDTVMTMTPDATDLLIDGLENINASNEVRVPLSSISGRRETRVGAAGE